MKILGITNHPIDDMQPSTGTGSVSASLFKALARSHDLMLADIRVKPGKLKFYRFIDRISFGAIGWCNNLDWTYQARSRNAHKIVSQYSDKVDLVFQMFWRYAPFLGKPLKPYVIYTDGTGRMLLRNWRDTSYTPSELNRVYSKEREVYRSAALVFVYNSLIRDSMIQDYGVDEDKVVIVGVGVDIDPISVDKEKDYSRKRLIFVGNDCAYERKGVPNLLRSFALVRQKIPEAQLELVGVSKGRRISQPGVIVAGKIEERERVGRMLEDATLFVMCPKQDLSPGVIREAMIKKLPCVATSVDGIPEMVVDGETGRLVPPEDPQALASVIIDLLNDENELKRMGLNGYNKAMENYLWDSVVSKINRSLSALDLS